MLSMRDSDNMVLAASHGRGLFYGEFSAESTETGDLNNDGSINILDVVMMVSIILGEEPYTSIADLNFDQNIDVMDIVLLINIIIE